MDSPFTNKALQYCDDVQSGRVLVCLQVRQAVKRHLDDLQKIDSEDFPYSFDESKAERVCRFASRLPHVAGRWAIQKNNRFVLQPWQAFLFTTLFGWVRKSDGLRRFQEVFISVPRKNGKSFVASVICLYCLLCDGEPGAQVFAAANNFEQAMTVFRPAKLMVERLQVLRDAFEIEANAKSMIIPDGSRFVPLVGTPRDGQSTHCAVLDEYHEAKEDSLYLSLAQSMGAREQPLMLVTTTAGVTIEGPCHILQKECEQVLEGSMDRPELFALIYTIDKDTDWTSEEALQMSNPNLGVSVNAPALRVEHLNAIRSAPKQNAFKTKKLNVWCNAATAWANMQRWAECSSVITPEMFEGQPCIMAADLSTKLDVTCVLKMFKIGAMFYVLPRFYLPSERALDPTLGMYAKWVSQGFLTPTEGVQIDMQQVLEDTVADVERYKPSAFCFDKWKAEFYTQLLGQRCPSTQLVEIPMDIRSLAPVMLELQAMIESKTLRHGSNPVMTWMMSNVVAKPDVKGNYYPRRAANESKIDGALCILMATSRFMAAPDYAPQSFEPFYL